MGAIDRCDLTSRQIQKYSTSHVGMVGRESSAQFAATAGRVLLAVYLNRVVDVGPVNLIHSYGCANF